MSEILKPCPFCGADEVELVDGNDGFWCRCQNCQSESGFYYIDQEAIEAWNRRAYDEQ